MFGPSVSIPFLEDDLEPFSSGGASSLGGSGGGGGGCKRKISLKKISYWKFIYWFTNLQIQNNKFLILASNKFLI